MNGYKCFYKGKSLDVFAQTSYEAQTQAAKLFKVAPSKQYMVDVYLCELAAGSQVETTLTN